MAVLRGRHEIFVRPFTNVGGAGQNKGRQREKQIRVHSMAIIKDSTTRERERLTLSTWRVPRWT